METEKLNIDEICASCLTRWQNRDEKISYFEEKLPGSLEHMTSEMRSIFLPLLEEFDYYSHKHINNDLAELHKKIMGLNDVDTDNSVFSILKSQKDILNSSCEYLMEYRNLNGLDKSLFYIDINGLKKEYWEYISNIILIDDFCGSGNTLMNFVDKYKEIIKGKKIVYAVIYCMEKGRKSIESYAENNSINIEIVSIRNGIAAFERNEELRSKRVLFSSESKKIGLKKDTDIYGYDQTEALVAFYNDTPNNTLGVFWKDTEHNTALFPRKRSKKPGWMVMADRKRRQKERNYNKEVDKING